LIEPSLFDTVLIALYVPKAKPTNNFELAPEVLALLWFINQKCVLYVFGNPYALQVIPNLKLAAGIVQVYQILLNLRECCNAISKRYLCKGVYPTY
jgi:hypothetical protein